MRFTFCIFAAILIIANTGLSSDEKHFTGNPNVDLFTGNTSANTPQPTFNQSIQSDIVGNKKSPFIAAGISLLIPGAGQFYNGDYVKGGMFLLTEAALWIFSSHFESKGDNTTSIFENYADARAYSKPEWDITEPDRYRTKWDVIRYYEWTEKNFFPGSSEYNDVIETNDKTMPPWERVNWDALNRLERGVSNKDNGKWYSHTLPKHGEQQYYELIGKYPQFNQGWDDATNANYTYGNPITENYKFYSQMRGTANDYYYKAKTAMTVVVVNHIISAVEAYFTARSYNTNLKAEARLENRETPFGKIPVVYATVKLKF